MARTLLLMTIFAGFILSMGCKKTESDIVDPNATFTIKFKPKQKGDRFECSDSVALVVSTKLPGASGKETENVERLNHRAEYTELVQEVPDPTSPPTKMRRSYTRAEAVDATAKVTSLPITNKTVWVEKQKGKYIYVLEGGTRLDDGASKGEIDQLYGDAVIPKIQEMLPKEPVKVDQTWEIHPSVLRNFAKGIGFATDIAKSKAYGKLTKAYSRNGATWGKIEFHFELKLDSALSKEAGNPNGFINYVFTFDIPIDGSSHEGTMIVTTDTELISKDNKAKITMDERREQVLKVVK